MHWLSVLAMEHDNLRQALRFCQGDPDGAEAGLRLGAALWRFWEIRCHFAEGLQHLAAALLREGGDSPTERLARARVLKGAGSICYRKGDSVTAKRFNEQSLPLWKELGDKRGLAICLNDLGLVAIDQGDYALARSYIEQSLELYREMGDRNGMKSLLGNLGIVAEGQGDYSTARTLYEQSIEFFRETGNWHAVANCLGDLGTVIGRQGDYPTARTILYEGMELHRTLGNRRGIAMCLLSLGRIAFHQGDYSEARTLLHQSLEGCREVGDSMGVAESLDWFGYLFCRLHQSERSILLMAACNVLRKTMRTPRIPADQGLYNEAIAGARSSLGDAAFDTAFAEGQAMTTERAIEFALSDGDWPHAVGRTA